MQTNSPTLTTLRRLRPLEEFDHKQLLALAQQLDQRTADKNECILELGSTLDSHLFILYGEVKLTSSEGDITTITINEEQTINPIAQLRPSLYNVTATQLTHYVFIPKTLLNAYSLLDNPTEENITLEVEESNSITDNLIFTIGQDILCDKLSLPSLPAIALKIQRAFHDDMSNINNIAEILISDPAITAKLIKIANSMVYQGEAPADTLQSAIIRLGLNATYRQVMAFAVHDVFHVNSPFLQQQMACLWAHSRKVAAISYVLAEQTQRFDPELAMLAGLIHDLGVMVILEYIEGNNIDTEGINIHHIIHILRPTITSMLMKKWNFPADIIMVAAQCEEWFRNETHEADLCDLVMIAQYHSFIGTDNMQKLPPITTMPALKKLNLNAKESIELVKNSRDKIHQLELLLL